MDSGSGTTRHAQGKREIIHFRDDTKIRYSVSTTEVERQNAIDVWQKKRLIGIRRDGTHNPTQELRRSVAMMGVTAGRRQLEHSGVRPLRRLRGTGSGLPTGVSVTWVDVQSVLLQILGTLDACSTSSAYGVTACFPIIH